MATKKVQEPTVNTPKKDSKAEGKSYTFTSANLYLTVSSLGVQFVNGKATVTDVAVARALATIDGVELVED